VDCAGPNQRPELPRSLASKAAVTGSLLPLSTSQQYRRCFPCAVVPIWRARTSSRRRHLVRAFWRVTRVTAPRGHPRRPCTARILGQPGEVGAEIADRRGVRASPSPSTVVRLADFCEPLATTKRIRPSRAGRRALSGARLGWAWPRPLERYLKPMESRARPARAGLQARRQVASAGALQRATRWSAEPPRFASY
jgi:hypothetical protein